MRIPRTSPPTWFASRLTLRQRSTVIVLDDDPSIHELWRHRLAEQEGSNALSILHFLTARELLSWSNQANSPVDPIYLIDFELCASGPTGLEIIRKLQISSNSYLVTSHHENVQVTEECNELRMRLIPKSMAGLIPISIQQPAHNLDSVLINKDPLARTNWWISAKMESKHVRVFPSTEGLLKECDQIPKSTPLYIDAATLADGGEEEEMKALRQAGFENMLLLDQPHP